MRTNNMLKQILITGLITLSVSQPTMAAKFKCWTNNEGIKECGSYVPPEYSQKRVETRGESGRVVEVKERAKTKEEIAEMERLAKLQAIEDAKIAEQKKQDDILLKTFSKERDINMLRDSKINVIEGLITVTKGNNKSLNKKLEKLRKKAANIERRGKKPPETLIGDIKAIENNIQKNKAAIKSKRAKQETIRADFNKDLERFRKLKGITK